MYRQLINIILVIAFPSYLVGQASLVLNDDGYLVIDNGSVGTPSYLVVDNNATTAVKVTGSGGNIISKGEFNQLKWNITTASSGTYTIPLTADNSVSDKIPVSMTILSGGTESGAGTGNVRFANWSVTTPATHAPFPSGAPTSLGSGPGTAQDVVDRWWIIDAQGYSTKPDPTLTFKFAPGVDADATDNPSMSAANLKAQVYNGGWNFVTYGTSNGTDEVNSVSPGVGGFNKIWALVESATPLPIELKSFTGKCVNGKKTIKWETETELNTLRFKIERGETVESLRLIEVMKAAGNSSSMRTYEFNDYSDPNQSFYYRLIAEDNDGSSKIEGTIFVKSCEDSQSIYNELEVSNAYSSDRIIAITLTNNASEELTVVIYDAVGQLIKSDRIFTYQQESNRFQIDLGSIANGIYFLYMEGSNGAYTKKFYLSGNK